MLKDALDAYEVAMTTQLKDELPCNNDQLRRSHEMALQNSEDQFMADTAGISIKTIEKYLKRLKVRYKNKRKQNSNSHSSSLTKKKACNNYLERT